MNSLDGLLHRMIETPIAWRVQSGTISTTALDRRRKGSRVSLTQSYGMRASTLPTSKWPRTKALSALGSIGSIFCCFTTRIKQGIRVI